MSFITPIWLWGLLGVAIPIGIHLLSRKEGKTIYIGSLRHLVDSNTTRFSSLRLNEILLLLLRITSIVLIVFFLAGLLSPFSDGPDKKWLLIEKGIENHQNLKSVTDSLQQNGFEAHYLSKGFPVFGDSILVEPVTNYNALLTDLQGQSLSEAVILTYAFSNHFKGERIAFPKNFRWISVEPETQSFIYEVEKLKGDSLKVRSGQSSSVSTSFKTKIVRSSQMAGAVYRNEKDTAVISPASSFRAGIFFSTPFESDANLIVSSLEAIASDLYIPISIMKASTSNFADNGAELNVWLSDEPTPENFKNGMAYRKCEEHGQFLLIPSHQAALFCRQVAEIEWVITKRLTQENILKENFTLAIAKIVGEKVNKGRRSFPDSRTLPTTFAWSKANVETRQRVSGQQVAETSLAVLLLLLLMAERWVAFKRNQ